MKLIDTINPGMFREYDIRGVYGDDLNEDVAYTIGKSFGSYIQEHGERKTVIGHDNRLSSPSLSNALITGIQESGVDVTDLGLVTTPMYYYARKYLKFNTGIMITASHNPKDNNGFKIAFSEMGNAYGELITQFRDYTNALHFKEGKGSLETFDIRDSYINLLKESIQLGDRKIKVVVDCGNGTGSIIIEEVLKALGITYDLLYAESDGTFPNHPSDPAVYENQLDLSKRVVELGYDFGFGIDGDADRVGVVDEKGTIWGADWYMLVMYRYLAPKMKQKKALFDIKCSKVLVDGIKELGLEATMYRTGNSYTNMMMQKGDFDFGGEYSGHVFFRDKFPGFDDGIYGGLRMMELLSHLDQPMSHLLENFPHFETSPEIKIPTPDAIKFQVVEFVKEAVLKKGYQVNLIDGVRVEFDDGWALVRASNTGPNLIVRFEATTKERLEERKQEFMDLIKSYGNQGRN